MLVVEHLARDVPLLATGAVGGQRAQAQLRAVLRGGGCRANALNDLDAWHEVEANR